MSQPYTMEELNRWTTRAIATYRAMGETRDDMLKDYFDLRRQEPGLTCIEVIQHIINAKWHEWYRMYWPERLN